MTNEELYSGREQTLVKHYILEKYLERFAHIIGFFCDTINYVDCFSGPWNVRSEELQDSSFYIAANQLRRAQATLRERGRDLKLRCFFLERVRTAYAKLEQFAKDTTYATIETKNALFEDSVPEILDFVDRGGSGSFTFLFIDPTGWTGFAIAKIAPLLSVRPSEVLINFMTGHIRRFIESPNQATQASFDNLFGRRVPRERFDGLSGIDLDDALVEEYSKSIAQGAEFKYVQAAIVLHPQIDKTHFHLIYATRNPKGVEVFKEAEERAMRVMESARARARQRKRQGKTGQAELYDLDALYDPTYYESLRERYISRARERVVNLLQTKDHIRYEDVWEVALKEPLVWERDLKDWIKQWVTEGKLGIEGLKPKERTPKRGQSHYLVWQHQGKQS